MRVNYFCRFRHRAAAFIFAGVLLVALSPSASAQLFSDDAAREQSRENADRIEKITAALRTLNESVDGLAVLMERDKNTRRQISELVQKIQSLEQQFRELRGRTDELQQQQSSEKKSLQKEQQADIIALRKQVGAFREEMTALGGEVKELSSYFQPPPENDLYTAAYTSFQQQSYEKAIQEFNRVLRFYPGGQFSANAQYWISQAHLSLQNFVAAKDSAAKLIQDHPESDKVAAAMLIIVRALLGMDDADAAQQQLLLLVDEYPTSLAADEARQLLAP